MWRFLHKQWYTRPSEIFGMGSWDFISRLIVVLAFLLAVFFALAGLTLLLAILVIFFATLASRLFVAMGLGFELCEDLGDKYMYERENARFLTAIMENGPGALIEVSKGVGYANVADQFTTHTVERGYLYVKGRTFVIDYHPDEGDPIHIEVSLGDGVYDRLYVIIGNHWRFINVDNANFPFIGSRVPTGREGNVAWYIAPTRVN